MAKVKVPGPLIFDPNTAAIAICIAFGVRPLFFSGTLPTRRLHSQRSRVRGVVGEQALCAGRARHSSGWAGETGLRRHAVFFYIITRHARTGVSVISQQYSSNLITSLPYRFSSDNFTSSTWCIYYLVLKAQIPWCVHRQPSNVEESKLRVLHKRRGVRGAQNFERRARHLCTPVPITPHAIISRPTQTSLSACKLDDEPLTGMYLMCIVHLDRETTMHSLSARLVSATSSSTLPPYIHPSP
ncbi:hypothetical protein GGR57DRAFT_135258 [Xylariaceae sp. FL1272]|nr:hypothetical protein GGR57DRAFT_135258 [Xylariaceae sp. FL1272]